MAILYKILIAAIIGMLLPYMDWYNTGTIEVWPYTAPSTQVYTVYSSIWVGQSGQGSNNKHDKNTDTFLYRPYELLAIYLYNNIIL